MTDLTEPVEQPPPSEPVPEAADPVEPRIRTTRSRGRTRPSAGHCSDSLLLFAGTWAVAFVYLAVA